MSKYPAFLSADPSGKPSKAQRSRSRREASGVFSLFEPAQIQQFKEAFSLIDQDRDGVVSERDLKEIFASLGEVFADLHDALPDPHRYHSH
jgi:myosin regulatory light chain 12